MGFFLSMLAVNSLGIQVLYSTTKMLEIGNWILLLIYLNFIQKINANPIKFNLVTHFILKFIFERFLLEFF